MDNGQMTSANFDPAGRYTIREYSSQRPFSSFLPGIAGPLGIPLWVFYVNRGQAVASFGIGSKDSSIVEFQPANKAYQVTATRGFRTFLKYREQDRLMLLEPFAPWPADRQRREMHIGLNELALVEQVQSPGMKISVLYFTLPDEPLAGLVRQLTITNTGEAPLELEVLDGLPQVIPYGADNGTLKHVSRTIEAWMRVENVEERLPFYRLQASAEDHAQVSAITAGHFALAWEDGRRGADPLPVIVDPGLVFQQDTSLHAPRGFVDNTLDELFTRPQARSGKTPSAFFGLKRRINPGQSIGLNGLYGHCSAYQQLQHQIGEMVYPGWLLDKRERAREIARDLVKAVHTRSSSALFDGYIQQTYLDNILRGGWPVIWEAEPAPHIYHIYSRRHGDLERDYNDFRLPPEYYSSGEGNYRDVNQNRRNDVFFNPRVGAQNIRDFLSLIQLDGYNPLVVKGRTFTLDAEARSAVSPHVGDPGLFNTFVESGFTPGGLLMDIRDHQLDLDLSPRDFLARVIEAAEPELQAEFGEGFWVDHWTYLMDQIDAYLALFPDRKSALLFGGDGIPYYRSPVRVLPRHKRYVLTAEGPRQYHALAKHGKPGWIQTPRGEKFRSTVFEKLVLLACVKFGTLDPGGMGVEMEAGKPGWYDALNGLPALFGSSLPESYELLRLITFLRESLSEIAAEKPIALPAEFASYLRALVDLTEEEQRPFQWWERANVLREDYRDKIYGGISGNKTKLPAGQLGDMLTVMESRVLKGLRRARAEGSHGLTPTYFRYQATAYETRRSPQDEDELDPNGLPYLEVEAFQSQPLPPFLEGAVRALKVCANPEEARAIHRAVKASPLWDRKLRMYKLNASLEEQPHQIGRARAFTPGWLENESIWLHMEYKYLLELLKAGLYEVFFDGFKEILIPFQPVERYSRSPLENSSFLVSSAHPQADLHGAGFVARLSGATAEFTHIWLLMMAGKNPFRLREEKLVLEFQPALPAWMFDEKDRVSFQFLGHTAVTVHNPRRINTWEERPARVEISLDDGSRKMIDKNMVPPPYAERIRENKARAVDLYYL